MWPLIIMSTSNIMCFVILENGIQVGAFQKRIF